MAFELGHSSKMCNVGGTPGPVLETIAVDLVQQCLLIFYTGLGSGSFFPILFFHRDFKKGDKNQKLGLHTFIKVASMIPLRTFIIGGTFLFHKSFFTVEKTVL